MRSVYARLPPLRACIRRQELDVYRNDVADGSAKLARLEETLEDLEDQAREAKTAIGTAQRQMDLQKSNTRAGVFRLRGGRRSTSARTTMLMLMLMLALATQMSCGTCKTSTCGGRRS